MDWECSGESTHNRTARREPRSPVLRSAFTLVELLVVIGVISALIAILLPTLRRARQAADSAACLSNLRQIGQASAMYRHDTGRLPFFFTLHRGGDSVVPPGSGTGTTVQYSVFSFGGRTTHDGIASGCYIDESEKPLTRYIARDVAAAAPFDGTRTPAADRAQRELFRCPADPPDGLGRPGFQPDYLCPGIASHYQRYGTSYYANRGFAQDPAITRLAWQMLKSPLTPENVDHFNVAVSRTILKWNAARTVLCAENWFNWSLFYQAMIVGVHSNSQPIHNVLFLDGHAASITMVGTDMDRPANWPANVYFPYRGADWSEFDERSSLMGAEYATTYTKSSPWSFSTPETTGAVAP